MLSIDLFDSKYEKRLHEGAVDDLEARRIDLLNDRMQELLARAKESNYKNNPAALAGLKREYQRFKDERDSYYKVREAGIPGNVPVEKIPGKEDLLKGRGRTYYEDQKKNSNNTPLNQKLQRLKVQARKEFPQVDSDQEALLLKLLDKESQDDEQNRRIDTRQDAELRKNFAFDQEQEEEIRDLQTGLQEQDDWYDDEDEEETDLRSGDYVRDRLDGEHGEIFRMQGDPNERRVQILDRDGRGWYITTDRLTRVDPDDINIQRYFGKRRHDMDESGVAEAEEERDYAISSRYVGDGQFQLLIDNRHKFILTVGGFEIDDLNPGQLDSYYLTDPRTGKTTHMAGGRDWDLEIQILVHMLQNQMPALKKIYAEDMAFYRKYGWDERVDRLQGLPLTGYQAIPVDRLLRAQDDVRRVTGQDGVAEAKWDPWTGGDFGDTHDMNHLPSDDDDKDPSAVSAEQFKAMIQYHGNNALVRRALDDLYRATVGSGYDDSVSRPEKYLATLEDQRTGKTKKQYFKSKEDAYRYAKGQNAVVTNLVKIDTQEDTSNLITLPVMLGLADHKKKWMLKFPSEDYAQKWEFKHKNAAQIQWPGGHALAEGALDKTTWMKQTRAQYPAAKFMQAKTPGAPIRAYVDNKVVAEFNFGQSSSVAEGTRGDAIKQGYQAAVKGLTKQQNPYYKSVNGKTPPEAYDWEAGWEDARDSGKIPQGVAEGKAVYYHVVDGNKKSVKAFMDSPSAVKFLNARRQKDPTAYKWKIVTKKNAVIGEQGVAESSEHNVGDTVNYSTKVAGFSKSAQGGQGKITKKTATHYTINGKEMPHGHVKSKSKGVAEAQLDEAPARDVLLGLLDKFYADMKLPPRQGSHSGALDIKSPGTKVWTRGDGTRLRDPGRIQASHWADDKQQAEKAATKFWPWLLKQPGVKSIGQVSGQFGSSPMTDAVSYKGLYFSGGPYGTEFGSMSRVKNPKSVWRHKPFELEPKAEQGVAEGQAANIITAFAIAGGALLGTWSGHISNTSQQRWMQAYEQIKQTDPATAEQIKQLVKKYRNSNAKTGPDVFTSRKIDKIIKDFEEQQLKKSDVDEGWSDKYGGVMRPPTPYSVYIKGKKWKDFATDDHAEAVANKLKAKFKADGRDPETITIAPTDYDQPIKEEQDTSGVESAIIRRIMVAHTDLLKQFGPQKVMQAAEEVAYNVGDVDEIGTSDVSAYVAQVRQILGATA
jgi:ribosome modulation factor